MAPIPKFDTVGLDNERISILDHKLLIVGKRECGKTNTALSIYNQIRKNVSELYYFSCKDCEFDGTKPYGVKDLHLLEKIIEEVKSNNEFCRALGENNHTCIILDGVMHEMKEIMKEDFWKNLMYNSSFMGVTLIITMQYPISMAPNFRSQFNHVMIANEDFAANRKRLYDHYYGMFPTCDEFRAALNVTPRYEFLTTINRIGSGRAIEDKIVRVAADELTDEAKVDLLQDNTILCSRIDMEDDIIDSGIDFMNYLRATDSTELLSDGNDGERARKINEIQYITSMISYLNSRLNTLAHELENL